MIPIHEEGPDTLRLTELLRGKVPGSREKAERPGALNVHTGFTALKKGGGTGFWARRRAAAQEAPAPQEAPEEPSEPAPGPR